MKESVRDARDVREGGRGKKLKMSDCFREIEIKIRIID